MCNNSLDDLFADAENGICTNSEPVDSYLGLVDLNEGLNSITYGFNGGTILETNAEDLKTDE